MYQDLKQMFWWPGMRGEIARFVKACLTCQKAKVERRCPPGELQTMEIPEWKWDSMTMDFVSHLPKTIRNHDAIWVIVDRLTKYAHFLQVNMTYTMEKLAKLYIREIVMLHERGDWEGMLPFVEFTYNNSYRSSIGMTPFEALYGRKCQTPKKLKATQSRQKSYADWHWRPLEFEIGDHVFLKVSRTTGVGRALKLRKYILDPTYIIKPDAVQRRDDLLVELPAACIEDTRVKELRGNSIRLVKVVWDPITSDATWKLGDRMREQCPHLFYDE
ncbi:uncharacterized protein LOC113866907 [Abrus precatorius]|uniref:Uncharacterized protein LOC113866907 n=1 Tax=Abrus precatorius TaxID=3816 RepID=A0A8B8LNN0_ABRPR|nr:uncharacterized protein LOC113866907 [Abrus precatorius]